MTRNIKRRDFLNGVALASGFTLQPTLLHAASSVSENRFSETGPTDYPPTKTGLRGSHPGSFEVAHQLAWQGIKPQSYTDLDEHYDLVVVGGGISGLAAAYFFRQQYGEHARILILDNHDDFGGHAKRNEFHTQGQMLLGFGGSINIEEPDNYSERAMGLLNELGIDIDQLHQAQDTDYSFASLANATGLFRHTQQGSKITVGRWIAAFHGNEETQSLLEQLPLVEDDKDKLREFLLGERDYLQDLSLIEMYRYASSTSYQQFLQQQVGLSETAVRTFEPFLRIGFGAGADSLSVLEAIGTGMPGLKAMGRLTKLVDNLVFDPEQPYRAEFFPDGNASIARMLVRRLIPAVASGDGMHDIVSARFDYQQLDQKEHPIRIRLNSTAVNVQQQGDGVSVAYVQQGQAKRVQAKHAILACYNGIIPHLCPDLPEAQQQHLKYGVKVPFVWANVLLRNGSAVRQAGANMYSCPDSYFSVVSEAPPTRLGDYQPRNQGDDPMVVFMGHAPAPINNGQQSGRDLFRLGRHKLYATPFETYEDEVFQQLDAMFAPYGLNVERDIEAITINRWSHGYAYSYMQLFDPDWEEGQAPHELGRKPFGRISIANSDSEAHAYADGAIDAAWRAVSEQILVASR